MSQTPRSRSNRVLLVDPDFRSAESLARLLRDDGYEVEVAINGTSAIGALSRAELPGWLVTELTVPLTDGLTIARYALAQDASLRVVLLTRHPYLVPPLSVFGGRAAFVLTKPLDYAELLEILADTHASPSNGPQTASPRS